jgi:hypothetical protein
MIGGLNNRAFAVVAGLIAAMALLGLAAARADELSDLRASQQILQQRIDQLQRELAQVPIAGSKAVPGTAALAGSYPRSFLIPGTNTSLRIGGYMDLQVDWYLKGGGFTGQSGGVNGVPTIVPGIGVGSVPLDIPAGFVVPGFPTPGHVVPVDLQHSRGRVFTMTPRQSRIHITTRTPTAWGEATTFFEFDFLNTDFVAGGQSNLLETTDSLTPRLRLAYGTLGPWLAGQAYSLQDDLTAGDNTIDFTFNYHEGPTRIPQLRYTQQLPDGLSGAIALEAPATDLLTPLGLIHQDFTGTLTGGTVNPAGGFINPAKNTYPDIVGAFTIHRPWGHLQLHSDIRSLEVADGRFFSKQYIGIEGGVSGNVRPGWFGWSKDRIGWDFGAGNGAGRALGLPWNFALVTNYGAFPITTKADAARVIFKPETGFVANVNYTHWWTSNLQTNADFDIVREDAPSNLIGPVEDIAANKEVWMTHLNLLWFPVAFIQIGVEWLHGHRTVVANLHGSMDDILGDFRVKF